jgi:hypothetical protein
VLRLAADAAIASVPRPALITPLPPPNTRRTGRDGFQNRRSARQLGITRHETAWMLLHKLRRAMVAPERELLKREVEVDEFYWGALKWACAAGESAARRRS